MIDWKKRPTLIEQWEEDIECVLAIDENGNSELEGIKSLLGGDIFERFIAGNDQTKYMHERWFTITGVMIERSQFPIYRDKINTIKYANWKDGIFNYKHGERRVVFHSREIRKKEGPFNPKIINYPHLMSDISSMIKDTDFQIYSASIDKIKHLIQYSNPYHVYTLCLDFIIERFCRYLNTFNKKGILMLEARGKEEDSFILKYLIRLLENGNNYHKKSHFENIQGVYFNPKWCFEKNNAKASFILLELADLVSFPIYKYIKTGSKDLAFEALESKLHNYPNFHGYGIKKFP
ncbi:DUF3800 domain-containing protein [Bacillus sp. CGMCC 1.16607]|uniref:DUF3800 domain-containing protein n=1 Tax=Bacillus sp. CGMCC 1.16607 TaxID=3351842 RepID=UPI0036333106